MWNGRYTTEAEQVAGDVAAVANLVMGQLVVVEAALEVAQEGSVAMVVVGVLAAVARETVAAANAAPDSPRPAPDATSQSSTHGSI